MDELVRDMVFTCPHCGSMARTTESDVDIHAGATFYCDRCGGAVIFVALTVQEYHAAMSAGLQRTNDG